MKDMEITNLKSQSDLLKNELRSEKELLERMNKPSKAIRYFEELMRSPRSSSDTSSLGNIKYSSSTKEGESSKNGDQRNEKTKRKATCHHCEKLGHMKNICKIKNGKNNPKL